MGLGETPEDRIDLAFTIRELGIRSMPVNMLNPIPYNSRLTENEMRTIVAIFRFILPDGRHTTGRRAGIAARQRKSLLLSGANAAISGDMITIETDMRLC